MWFAVTLHLGLPGRELQTKIMESNLEFNKDSNGEFCHLGTDIATKTILVDADLLAKTVGQAYILTN